jgi:hypothetical protein
MSVVEDGRKLAQDFLAPELRAVAVRLDALEKRYDSLDHKIDEVDRRAEKRHDQIIAAIASLADYTSIRERVARLEARDNPHQ